MILLHAAPVQGRLFVWGESPPTPAPRRRTARPRGGPALSPFATDPLALGAALHAAVPSLGAMGRGQPFAAWLPTTNGAPLPSSPLIVPDAGARGALRVAPWRVSALPLGAHQALALLAASIGRDVLAPGLVVAKDLAFWAHTLRFAAGLVARERFLPGLVADDGSWRARWTPVYDAADAGRRHALIEAMPAAGGALADLRTDTPPLTGPAEGLDTVVDALVDHLVRSAGPHPAPRQPESVHEAWVAALFSDDGAVVRPAPEVDALARAVREWRRPVALTAAAPFRLCFRLEEPPPDKAAWSVRYLLQSRRDPSLLVPAEQAWKGAAAERLLDAGAVREHLLTALGQASGLCPPVEQSLRGQDPAGYTTDTRGALAFLSHSAAALEQAGFGVLLPSWWTGSGTRLRLGVRGQARSPKLKESGSGVGLEELVKFAWQVAVGGEPLTASELQALARAKEPLVRVRGQWVHVSAEEIRAALELWRKKPAATSMRDVLRLALGAQPALGPLPVEGVAATGWAGDVLARLGGDAAFEELPPPDDLQADLRPYQRRGFSWLSFLRQWGLGACLADDMGLGKTVQTLAHLLQVRGSAGWRPALVVCPMSVIGNWRREAERFAPALPVLVHHGAGRGRGEAFSRAVHEHAVVITSYALLQREAERFAEVEWSSVVLDEAQNVKNPETRQARAARSLRAAHRIALTGTPVENNVGDLWSLMEFLNPGLLGSQAEFKRTFFLPIQVSRDAAATERLRRATGPFILRRLKTDRSVIADLPEKMEMKVFCTLTREQASLYKAVLSDAEKAMAKSEGIARKGVVLATLSRLKQVCNHPAQLLADNSPLGGRSGKLARLAEMLEEVQQSGEKALVFSQYAEMGALVVAHLQETFGREVLFLHGGVPRGRRERMIERFQSEEAGTPQVFVLSLKAGGTGLNLTRASHVFHYDRWWNPAVEQQATDRAFRIGQTRRVQVHAFVCLGTLEEKIDAMLEGKQGLAESVVGAGEAWLTELGTEELRAVLALRPEAVAE